MSLLVTDKLSIGYINKGNKIPVQHDLNLSIRAGEMICLIGPNGTGKSTLLRTLSGLQPAISGKIRIDERELSDLTVSERSFLISLVLTDRIEIDNATVYSIVAMGRQPFSNWWGSIKAEDELKIQEAIKMVHLEHKAGALLSELSDGEKQRALIAKAFVQDTPLIMLDEPTAHLDLPNRVEIMLLLHKLAHKTGKAVLLSTHELDMALQAADSIWLMTSEKGVETGVPEDLVLNGHFNEAFFSPNYVFNPSNGNFSMNYQLHGEVQVSGDKTRLYWTLRALARAGYAAVERADCHIQVESDHWKMGETSFLTISELLQAIKTTSLHASL